MRRKGCLERRQAIICKRPGKKASAFCGPGGGGGGHPGGAAPPPPQGGQKAWLLQRRILVADKRRKLPAAGGDYRCHMAHSARTDIAAAPPRCPRFSGLELLHELCLRQQRVVGVERGHLCRRLAGRVLRCRAGSCAQQLLHHTQAAIAGCVVCSTSVHRQAALASALCGVQLLHHAEAATALPVAEGVHCGLGRIGSADHGGC